MKILSLFDGISIAQQALKNCGIKVEVYYASEIDKYAIQITQKNFPNTIQLGSVVDFYPTPLICGNIDLIIGGSPCQDLSIAKKNREGLAGSRSSLFYEYVRILKEVKPKYFILENVNSMPKEAKQIITDELFGIEPIMINASLVSAQNRKRLFWVGKLVGDTYVKVDVPLPKDRGILLKDILEQEVDEKYYVSSKHTEAMIRTRKSKQLNIPNENGKCGTVTASYYKIPNDGNYIPVRVGHLNQGGQGDRIYSPDGKSVNLSANGGGRGAKTGLYAISKPVILGSEKLQVLKEERTELGKKLRKEIREKTGKDSTSRSAGYKAYYGREGLKANCITTSLGAEGMIVENYQISKLTPIESGQEDKTGLYAVGCASRTYPRYKEQGVERSKQIEIRDDEKANSMTSVQGDSMVAIVPEATKKGYAVAREGQSIDLSFPTSKTRRGRVGDKVKNLMTSQNIGVLQNSGIRKLTPIECERLQSLPDNYTAGVSNTQRYKACGNGFNCAVIEHILKHII